MKKKYLQKVFLVTILIVFCLQIFRVFLASVLWYCFNALGNPVAIAGIAFVIFLSGLLAAPVCRMFGIKRFFALTAGALVGVRFLLQCIKSPSIVAVLSFAGIIMMTWFIVLWFNTDENTSDDSQPQILVIALPAAVLFDTLSRIFLSGYDLVWHKHVWSVVTIVLICIAVIGALKLVLAQFKEEEKILAGSFGAALPLFAFGSWLYLNMGFLQNIPALTGISRSSDVQISIIITVCNSIGLIFVQLFRFLGKRPAAQQQVPQVLFLPAA